MEVEANEVQTDVETFANNENRESGRYPVLQYEDWLSVWGQITALAPTRPCILDTASIVSTPLISTNWSSALDTYPNRVLVDSFIQGITQGFRIGFSYGSQPLKGAKHNLEGALSHPQVVENTEVSLRRVAGPYSTTSLPNCQISRYGIIPINHQPGKWRLIVDLSYPKGRSVNDGIPKRLVLT